MFSPLPIIPYHSSMWHWAQKEETLWRLEQGLLRAEPGTWGIWQQCLGFKHGVILSRRRIKAACSNEPLRAWQIPNRSHRTQLVLTVWTWQSYLCIGTGSGWEGDSANHGSQSRAPEGLNCAQPQFAYWDWLYYDVEYGLNEPQWGCIWR